MKEWIFFGIGVAVGSAVTFYTVKKHFQKLAFDEINEVRDMYKKKYAAKDLADKNSEEKAKMMEKIGKTDTLNTKLTHKNGKTDTQTDTYSDYTSIIDRYSGVNGEKFNVFSNPPDAEKIDNGADEMDIYDDDPYSFVVDHSGPSEGISDRPFLISEDEFASEKLFYDKVMVEYYDDGVAVIEDTDEIIESIEDLIGPNILDRSFDEDTIYVRNDNRSTDYGIIFKGTNFVPEEGFD